MKLTVENIVDSNLKPEDIELDFKWMLFKITWPNGNVHLILQFGDTSFLPSYWKKISLHDCSDSDDAKAWAAAAYNSPCYKKTIEELRNAFDAWKKEHNVPQAHACYSGYMGTLRDLQDYLDANHVSKCFNLSSMDIIEIAH